MFLLQLTNQYRKLQWLLLNRYYPIAGLHFPVGGQTRKAPKFLCSSTEISSVNLLVNYWTKDVGKALSPDRWHHERTESWHLRSCSLAPSPVHDWKKVNATYVNAEWMVHEAGDGEDLGMRPQLILANTLCLWQGFILGTDHIWLVTHVLLHGCGTQQHFVWQTAFIKLRNHNNMEEVTT